MVLASRRTFGALIMLLLASVSIDTAQQADLRPGTARVAPVIERSVTEPTRPGARPFVRTELFFGTAKPRGVVSAKEFRKFVDECVTPRFPDGLTLLKGDGQFRGEANITVRDRSFVLILLYPHDNFDQSTQRIERIRTLYKEQFDQESVLRVDDPYVVWVSF
jgi:hypothetical protein